MLFAKARGCELELDGELQRTLEIRHRCDRRESVDFAHLADERRYADGDVGSGLCRTVHFGIDGNRIGGKPDWYVVRDRAGQHLIRMRLSNRARAAWDALTPEEREGWNARANAREHERLSGPIPAQEPTASKES